jgi:hypothetical protein
LLYEDTVQDISNVKSMIFKDDPTLSDTLEKLGVKIPVIPSPYVFNLEFPNSYFYCYHELELKILNSNYNLFKIQIDGFKPLGSGYYPTQYLTIIDHNPKYYNPKTGYEWRIMSGMIGCTKYKTSILNKPQQSNFKDYLSKGLVSDLSQIYPYPETNPPKYVGLDIQNSDMLETQSHGLDILCNYQNYIDKTYDFVMCNSSHKLNFSFIEENPSSTTSSIYYSMSRLADAIGRVGLSQSQLDKLVNLDTNVKVSFVSINGNHTLVPLGTLSFANPSINLENFYYLLTKQYSEIFLIIDVPNSQLYQWLQIDMIFGLVFFDTVQRRHIAQNFNHNE